MEDALLYAAVARQDEKAVRFLLRHGARANARIDTAEDPLERFGSLRSQEMRELLESFSLDPAGQRRRRSGSLSRLRPEKASRTSAALGARDEPRRTRSFSMDIFRMLGGKSAEKPASEETRSNYGAWDVRRFCRAAQPAAGRPAQVVEWLGVEEPRRPLRTREQPRQELPSESKRQGFFMLNVCGIGRGRSSKKTVSRAELRRRLEASMPTAMHQAAARGNLGIISALATYGADVDAELEESWSPLDVAAFHGRAEAAGLLLKLGADVNRRLASGRTALYHALKARRPELAELLLQRGALANTRTQRGVTPLHVAVDRACPEAVGLLLERGCEPNARTKDNVTPLHVAAALGRHDIVEMLIKAGADVGLILGRSGKLDVRPLEFQAGEEERKRLDAVIEKYAPKPGVCGKIVRKLWVSVNGRREKPRVASET